MAEFSLDDNTLTHETVADGSAHYVPLVGGGLDIRRFGIFTYYRIYSTLSLVYQCEILPQPRPELRLVFLTKGAGIRMGRGAKAKAFASGDCNCSFVKAGCSQKLVIDGSEGCELFMLVVNISDISLPVADSHPRFRGLLNADQCTWLFHAHMQLGMRKLSVIQQILHEHKPEYLQSAFVQLKLAELLVLFLEKAEDYVQWEGAAHLRPEELERVKKVRAMLHDDPAADYSLVKLAHEVGTNETSLKNNFKAVYGITVFGYLTARRMELARSLLLDENLKVSAVAQVVGYKYASHFSAAFRKYFGYLPTKLVRLVVAAPAYLSAASSMGVGTYLSVL